VYSNCGTIALFICYVVIIPNGSNWHCQLETLWRVCIAVAAVLYTPGNSAFFYLHCDQSSVKLID